ncbi:hypothetical protein JCM8547_006748 [Rhodosporidiobolus lusitaniae]
MRVKRWVLSPCTRPPDRSRLPSPSSLPAAAAPPSPPRLPQLQLPPAVALARQRASLFHRSPSPSSLPSYSHPDPSYFLRATLRQLPRVSHFPRLNLLPLEQLEQQLPRWRSACYAAHAALSPGGQLAHLLEQKSGCGGGQDDKGEKLKQEVAKTVGQTMRILLRLGEVDAARELDGAFFGTGQVVGSKRGGRKHWRWRRAAGQAGARREGGEGRTVWQGLGMERGEIRLAWMSSFAVRLDEAVQRGDDDGLKEFGGLLRDLFEQRGEGGVREDPCLTAFLTRKMGVVQAQLAGRQAGAAAGAGEEARDEQDGIEQLREQVRRLMLHIKDAEADEVEVVSFALLETALDRLERAKGSVLDDPFFGKVESDIQSLVGSLEPSSMDGFRAFHNLFLSYTSSLERHAHILHLAIRFLLLRARHSCAISPSSTSSSPAIPPLSSAAQLYSLLLELTPRLDPSVFDALSGLRQRQSSALYRLLAAHVAVLSSSNERETVVSVAERALDLVDLSLSSLSSLPSTSSLPTPSTSPAVPDPRALGLSTRFFRRLLHALTHTSSPSPCPDSPAPYPTPSYAADRPIARWSLLSRVMRTMLRARGWDASFVSPPLPSPPASACKGKHGENEKDQDAREVLLQAEQPLFVQPNLAMALVRSALRPSPPPSRQHEEEEGEQGGRTPLERLSSLLNFVEGLEATSSPSLPAPAASSPSAAPAPSVLGIGERRARRLVAQAVSSLLSPSPSSSSSPSFSPSFLSREDSHEVERRVWKWAQEGRDWDAVKGEVQRREEEKGKKGKRDRRRALWWEGKRKRDEGHQRAERAREKQGKEKEGEKPSASTTPSSTARPAASSPASPAASRPPSARRRDSSFFTRTAPPSSSSSS